MAGCHASSLTTCMLWVNSRTKPRHWAMTWNSSARGGLAQMVECSLSMREVTGSIPVSSSYLFHFETTGLSCYLWAIDAFARLLVQNSQSIFHEKRSHFCMNLTLRWHWCAPLGADKDSVSDCLLVPLTFPYSCKHERTAWTGTWTLDPQIKSLMLYRLSYPGPTKVSYIRKSHLCGTFSLKPFIIPLRPRTHIKKHVTYTLYLWGAACFTAAY